MAHRLPTSLWVIVLMGFFVSLAYSFYFKIEPAVDARAYDTIAWNLVTGRGYAETPDVPRAEDYSIGRVGPGYELFLAAFFSTFGHSYPIVWFIQAILHAASGFLLFLIARKLFPGERGVLAGLIAAASFLFFVDIVELSAMLMTETLLLFFCILSVYLFVRFYEKPTPLNAFYLGCASAAAAMTRPTLLLFVIMFIAFCLARRYLKQALVIAACFTILIGPWALRNYFIFHRVILTTAAGGYDLWVGNNPQADGELDPTQAIKDFSNSHSIFETNAEGLRQVYAFIFRHPLTEARLLLLKTSIYFSSARPAAFWFHLHGTSRLLTVLFSSSFVFLLFSFGFAGLRFLWREGSYLYRWLILLAAAMPLSVIPIVVETRYRYALYPFLALFAGYFLARLVENYRNSPRGLGAFGRTNKSELVTLTAATAIVFADTALDVLLNLSRIGERLHS